MDMGFLQKEGIFFQVSIKIGAAISGPRIADTNFTDTRIFLNYSYSYSSLLLKSNSQITGSNAPRGFSGALPNHSDRGELFFNLSYCRDQNYSGSGKKGLQEINSEKKSCQ